MEDMERDGAALPASIDDDAVPDSCSPPFHGPVALLVPVAVSGRALLVNINIDEGLLARIDDVSKRSGLSRSALLARGARMVIADEVGG